MREARIKKYIVMGLSVFALHFAAWVYVSLASKTPPQPTFAEGAQAILLLPLGFDFALLGNSIAWGIVAGSIVAIGDLPGRRWQLVSYALRAVAGLALIGMGALLVFATILDLGMFNALDQTMQAAYGVALGIAGLVVMGWRPIRRRRSP